MPNELELEYKTPFGCQNEECCARRPIYVVNDDKFEYSGNYDVLTQCTVCDTSCCWSCVYVSRQSPNLQCPIKRCGALQANPDNAMLDTGARMHTFVHEVINGDFSQDKNTGNYTVLTVIARYVLRGHLSEAAQYTCCHVTKSSPNDDKSKKLDIETTTCAREICTRADEMLAKYNIRAFKIQPGIEPQRITDEFLGKLPQKYNRDENSKLPIADNKYAQNVMTLYNVMTNISLDGIRKHSMLENAAKAACVVLWNQ